MNRSSRARYVPALRFNSLTPLYDSVVAITTREKSFKRALLEQSAIQAGHRVLDLACGTGTLAIKIRQISAATEVTGIDGDPAILSIARRKAERAGARVQFDLGDACSLPYPDSRFDRVLSSLFFHHLDREQKAQALQEVFRILRPGGQLHVADWGKASNALMRTLFILVERLDGVDGTRDNVTGRLPDFFRHAGFRDVEGHRAFSTVFGTLALYSAVKPSEERR